MTFRSEKQRRCVMAMLRDHGFSSNSAKFIVEKNPGVAKVSPRIRKLLKEDPGLKKKNFKQLQKKGVFLKFQADSDKDGVVNIRDCKPLDPKRKGIIHDLIKKKQQFEKKRSKQLEQEQDKLLKNIDSERTTLKKHLVVQNKINDNKKLKQELADLKRANFQQTKTGKIVVATRKGLITVGKTITSKQTKRFFKKLFR